MSGVLKLEQTNRVSEVPVLVTYVRGQLAERIVFRSELERVPEHIRLWRADLMKRANDQSSAAGLKAWLESQEELLQNDREYSTAANGHR